MSSSCVIILIIDDICKQFAMIEVWIRLLYDDWEPKWHSIGGYEKLLNNNFIHDSISTVILVLYACLNM